MEGEIERRDYRICELRMETGEDGAEHIRGYASVFDAVSLPLIDLPRFKLREKFERGAFAETLRDDDIRALVNHDPNYVLGRNVAGTLTLREDEHGLAIDVAPPDTQWARDLKISMRRGDVSGMSIGFMPLEEEWTVKQDNESGETEETVTVKKARLYDVSVVTFPAYPQTSAHVRSQLDARRRRASDGGEQGLPPDNNAADQGEGADGEAGAGPRASVDVLRRQLDVLEFELGR
jgi:hypothetical protein